MGTPATAFRNALGTRLRALRERGGARQEDIALAGRTLGLPWRRVVVAQLETGRRHLTAEEWLFLPSILTTALALRRPLGWSDLVPKTRRLSLTKELSGSGGGLATLCATDGRMTARLKTEFVWRADGHEGDTARLRSMARRLWKRKVRISDLSAAIVAARGDAEQKAARQLKVSPQEVSIAAFGVWGHSLTAERERRLVGSGTTSPRSLQARRGHVTRTLLTELRDSLAHVPGQRRAKGRTPARPELEEPGDVFRQMVVD